MAPPSILLLGAHGKVSLNLIPLLLARSWSVTALIRDPAQTDDILATKSKIPQSAKSPGQLHVLVSSLADVKTPSQAHEIISRSGANWVVWSAGAGGKGGPSNTNAVDRTASIAFAAAAVRNNNVKKFLQVSQIGSRQHAAPWWSKEEAEGVKKASDSIKVYSDAKLAADEVLTYLAEERRHSERAAGVSKEDSFTYIVLRPGALTEGKATGKVQLGHTSGRGSVDREDVARVADALLAKDGANGWFDLLAGEEGISAAVDRVVEKGIDCREGEDLQEMKTALEEAERHW
jgi:nucleoside-diphosphate-sugar epimerase